MNSFVDCQSVISAMWSMKCTKDMRVHHVCCEGYKMRLLFWNHWPCLCHASFSLGRYTNMSGLQGRPLLGWTRYCVAGAPQRLRWAPCELGQISAQAQGEPRAEPPPRRLLQCRQSGLVLQWSKHCSYTPGVTWYLEILICKCSAQLIPLRKVNQPAHSKCLAWEKITSPEQGCLLM